MTTTQIDPPVTECPAWCRYSARDHGWSEVTHEGHDARPHVVDYGTVDASTDISRKHGRPLDVFVSLMQMETLVDGVSEYGPLRIALSADDFPQLTGSEARRAAALLLAAADKLDEIVGEK